MATSSQTLTPLEPVQVQSHWSNGGGIYGMPPPSYQMVQANGACGPPAPCSGGGGTPTSPNFDLSSTQFPDGAKKSRLEIAQTSVTLGGSPSDSSGAISNQSSEELCLVCGDKASGYHYNALTCEGCKGFFRRSITKGARYLCKYGGNCDIDMYMRRKCQACRLAKCHGIGMRPEHLKRSRILVVIPEEQCQAKRKAKAKQRELEQQRKSTSPQQVTSTGESLSPNSTTTATAPGLSVEQKELINRLIHYQEQYEMPSDEDLAGLTAFTSQPGQQQSSEFQHLAELTILYTQLITQFIRQLPGFATLSYEDQNVLMKGSSTEVLMLRNARQYDAKSDSIVMGNQVTNWHYNRDSYRRTIGSATDAIFEFARSMSKMKVDQAEYALLTAIAIFSERPGLHEPKKVEDIQEVYTTTLQAYIDVHRPKNRTIFARLLMKLTDLRSLSAEHSDAMSGIKMEPPATPTLYNNQYTMDSPYATLQYQPQSLQNHQNHQNLQSHQNLQNLQNHQYYLPNAIGANNLMPKIPPNAGILMNAANGFRTPNVRIKVEPLMQQETEAIEYATLGNMPVDFMHQNGAGANQLYNFFTAQEHC